MPERTALPWWRWLGLSAVVLVLDLATKAWITAALAPGDVRVLTPFLNLVLWHNTGAAFSFLAGGGGWQRWFLVAVTLVVSGVLLAMLRRNPGRRPLAPALALVLGGAAGNLWDRLTLGHVVDFVQLHAAGYYWPAFNVADSAITVGVVLIVLDGLRETRTPAGAGADPKSR